MNDIYQDIAEEEQELRGIQLEEAEGEGDCFPSAVRYLITHAPRKPGEAWFLVHGLVRHPETGKHHWHAWVESDGEFSLPYTSGGKVQVRKVQITQVYDYANGHSYEGTAQLYYKIGEVKLTHRYTLEEATAKMERTGNYGPWESVE